MDIQSLVEAKQVGPAMLVTGALNPYTSAHESVAEMAMQHAMDNGHTHFYHGIGASEMKPDAPLTHEQKSKIVADSHRHLTKKLDSKLKTEVIPKANSVSPFHQIAYLIDRGHKDITVAIGSDQMGEGGLRSSIEKHMRQHGGFLGMDNKPHQVNIQFHQMGQARHEGDISRDAILREIGKGNIRSVKAGRLRTAVEGGDFELASAMMPASVRNKKAYFKLIADQQAKVREAKAAKAKKPAKKKKLSEEFTMDKIVEFTNVMNEAKILWPIVQERKAKRLDTIQKMKTNIAKEMSAIVDQQRTFRATSGTSPELHAQQTMERQQARASMMDNIKDALINLSDKFRRKIVKRKVVAVQRGEDLPPRRTGMPQEARRGTMMEMTNPNTTKESFVHNFIQTLTEAAKRRRAKTTSAGVKMRKKVRTEVRAGARGANKQGKDKIRKQEDRREAKKSRKYAIVKGKDGKIRIVTKEDIGKSKVIVEPENFSKNSARSYLDDKAFEITDSSKALFPDFKRKKGEGKAEGKNKDGKSVKKKKAGKKGKKAEAKKAGKAAPTVTSKPPRDVLGQQFPLPKTPPKGKKISSAKSQYPDWDHDAVQLEEAIPALMNQMMGIRTGSEQQATLQAMQTSQTLAASAQRAVQLITKQIGPAVAIHMGKNNGKPTKTWLSAGAVNGTSKSDVVFVPKEVWDKTEGKTAEEKAKNVDPKKCIRASMKCGSSRLLNGESGEAIATVNAGNAYAGDIASKNPKVAKLVKQVKKMISEFAKSADLGVYSIDDIRRLTDSGELPKDRQFAQARKIVEAQDELKEKVNSLLNEIYNASEEFKIGVVLESLTGNMKFGPKAIQAATHVLACNLDGTGVKLEPISEEMVRKIMPDLQFRGAFKGRSRKSGGVKTRTLSTLYNIDYNPKGKLQEDIGGDDYYQQDQDLLSPQDQNTQIQQQQPLLNFAGNSAMVEEDLRQIGDNVPALTEYCDLEPAMISSNEVDLTEYMQGEARTYNLITIDGKRQVVIPVQDLQTFEPVPQDMEESYQFINDFLVENMDDDGAFELALSSGLVSPETIMEAADQVDMVKVLHEMWENSLLNPELFEQFLQEAKKRNYKKEYREYHGKPEQRANRSKRVLARRKMIKNGHARKGDGKDVHHEDGDPQNNKMSNLRMTSKKFNRGLKEEHGAGEEGTDQLRDRYLADTPLMTINDPAKMIKKVVKHGIHRK